MVWKIRYYKKQFSKLKSSAQCKGDSKNFGEIKKMKSPKLSFKTLQIQSLWILYL